MCDIKDLVKNCGAPNPPGTETVLYIVPESEITTFPGLLATTGPGDSVILDGPIVLDAVTTGIGFFRQIPIVSNSGMVNDNMVGEIGGRSFESDFTFFVAGTEEDRLEFANNMANCCFVAMIRTKTGKYRVIGKLGDPAYANEIAATTGAAPGDRNGTAYVLKYDSGKTLPFYDADAHGIDITPNP